MKRVLLFAALPLLLAAFAVAAGVSPVSALASIGESAFGSAYAIHSNLLVRWAPLALAGLAAAVAFQAGVWNIGIEGQLLAGAVAALATAPAAGPWAALAAGAIAGALWASAAAAFMRRHAASVIIVTLMLNFVAELVVGLLVNGPLQEPTGVYPQSAALAAGARLPAIAGTRAHAGLALAVLAVGLCWWVMSRTVTGFRLRLTGAGERAARYSGGVDVDRMRVGALIASGALAGLAGAGELAGVTGILYEKFSPGYGFTAIAVALAGALHPLGVGAAALFFAAIEAGAAGLQRDAGLPAVATLVVEGAAVLISLALFKPTAPRSDD